VQHPEGCCAALFALIPRVRTGTEEKPKSVSVEISPEGLALETRKQVAEGCRVVISEADGAREVLDEDFSSKAVFADQRA